MYTSIPYPEFLTSNLLITHENFVDYEDDEDESSKSQGGVLTEEEDLGPDLSFEALEVLGYKCGVVECGKVGAVIMADSITSFSRLSLCPSLPPPWSP